VPSFEPAITALLREATGEERMRENEMMEERRK
jgi:hypothetical protein